MSDDHSLSEDQKQRVAATLARIRKGLAEAQISSVEPAPIFKPEAFDDRRM